MSPESPNPLPLAHPGDGHLRSRDLRSRRRLRPRHDQPGDRPVRLRAGGAGADPLEGPGAEALTAEMALETVSSFVRQNVFGHGSFLAQADHVPLFATIFCVSTFRMSDTRVPWHGVCLVGICILEFAWGKRPSRPACALFGLPCNVGDEAVGVRYRIVTPSRGHCGYKE